MKPDYFMGFLFFIVSCSYIKPYHVQVIKLSPKVRSFPHDIFEPSLCKICNYKKGICCLNVTFTVNTTLYFGIPSSRRIIRQVRTKYHSLVSSSRPLLRRIASSHDPSHNGVLDIIMPPYPNYTISQTHQLSSYKQYYNNISEIRKNRTTNLLSTKTINFTNQVTASINSTMPNALTHLLNDSIATARQSPLIRSHKYSLIRSYDHQENRILVETFFRSLERFERLLYQTTFHKLLSISPANRQENGISFIQSALFLYLSLLAISTEVNQSTRVEIENCLRYKASNMNKMKILKHMMTWLPHSNSNMKFRWTSRLVVHSELPVSPRFVDSAAAAGLRVSKLNCSNSPEVITKTLDRMVEDDSGGAMRNTFDEDDLLDGVCSILMTTVYIRARWRSAPTVLNNTRRFYDTSDSPDRSVRMIRINDVMQYAALDEWNADAIEIRYGAPGLTLLLLVPRGYSIRSLAGVMGNTSIQTVLKRMRTMRVAATLPIYTLRMTLLLPGKLESMGISHLIRRENFSRCDEIQLSHAVQRLMFWAEAGRNAFKDDGIEWDETPELELVVNRPYLFYVRWKNITLMNGNFVL